MLHGYASQGPFPVPGTDTSRVRYRFAWDWYPKRIHKVGYVGYCWGQQIRSRGRVGYDFCTKPTYLTSLMKCQRPKFIIHYWVSFLKSQNSLLTRLRKVQSPGIRRRLAARRSSTVSKFIGLLVDRFILLQVAPHFFSFEFFFSTLIGFFLNSHRFFSSPESETPSPHFFFTGVPLLFFNLRHSSFHYSS